MKIYSVYDKEFAPYGRVIEGYDTKELLEKLVELTPQPEDGTIYVASDERLEVLPVFADFRDNLHSDHKIITGKMHRIIGIDCSADIFIPIQLPPQTDRKIVHCKKTCINITDQFIVLDFPRSIQ